MLWMKMSKRSKNRIVYFRCDSKTMNAFADLFIFFAWKIILCSVCWVFIKTIADRIYFHSDRFIKPWLLLDVENRAIMTKIEEKQTEGGGEKITQHYDYGDDKIKSTRKINKNSHFGCTQFSSEFRFFVGK